MQNYLTFLILERKARIIIDTTIIYVSMFFNAWARAMKAVLQGRRR